MPLPQFRMPWPWVKQVALDLGGAGPFNRLLSHGINQAPGELFVIWRSVSAPLPSFLPLCARMH
jgi:hypothetical protein